MSDWEAADPVCFVESRRGDRSPHVAQQECDGTLHGRRCRFLVCNACAEKLGACPDCGASWLVARAAEGGGPQQAEPHWGLMTESQRMAFVREHGAAAAKELMQKTKRGSAIGAAAEMAAAAVTEMPRGYNPIDRTWVSKDGRVTPIEKLAEPHLLNALALIARGMPALSKGSQQEAQALVSFAALASEAKRRGLTPKTHAELFKQAGLGPPLQADIVDAADAWEKAHVSSAVSLDRFRGLRADEESL